MCALFGSHHYAFSVPGWELATVHNSIMYLCTSVYNIQAKSIQEYTRVYMYTIAGIENDQPVTRTTLNHKHPTLNHKHPTRP